MKLVKVLANNIDDANELFIYIINDRFFYKNRIIPAINNLAKKMAKGVYDKDKAVKLWLYLVQDGAKQYKKEYGANFSTSIKKLTAQFIADHYSSDIEKEAEKIKK